MFIKLSWCDIGWDIIVNTDSIKFIELTETMQYDNTYIINIWWNDNSYTPYTFKTRKERDTAYTELKERLKKVDWIKYSRYNYLEDIDKEK